MAKVMFAVGWIVIYAYLLEIFFGWYSGDRYEAWTIFHGRPFGPNAVVFYAQMAGNAIIPQLLWWRRVRRSVVALFLVSLAVQVGMWSERFVIIVQSLQQDYLPSSWAAYTPTLVDLGILGGTMCFFLFLFLLFLRFIPFIPVSEMKELRHEMHHEESHR
jgi:molybdopterin-containing oxidoreductase family membrane subunit